MGKFKEEHGKTRVGKFLKDLGDVADPILSAAGDLTGIKAFDAISDAIVTSKELDDETKKEALKKINLDIQDRADARDMQKVALTQSDLFSKRFIYYMASFWSILAGGFILIVLFKPIPPENIRLIDTILGFLLGTIVASIITFFFGSSEGSSKKNDLIAKMKGVVDK